MAERGAAKWLFFPFSADNGDCRVDLCTQGIEIGGEGRANVMDGVADPTVPERADIDLPIS